MRALLAELPGALFLAVLTAVVTLMLAIVLSYTLGSDQRARLEQSRCYAALSNAMLHDLLDERGITNNYPRISFAGVDCSFLRQPFSPPQ